MGNVEIFIKEKKNLIEIYQYAVKRRRNAILIGYIIYSVMYQNSSRNL